MLILSFIDQLIVIEKANRAVSCLATIGQHLLSSSYLKHQLSTV
jgi:hypothetical protein